MAVLANAHAFDSVRVHADVVAHGGCRGVGQRHQHTGRRSQGTELGRHLSARSDLHADAVIGVHYIHLLYGGMRVRAGARALSLSARHQSQNQRR